MAVCAAAAALPAGAYALMSPGVVARVFSRTGVLQPATLEALGHLRGYATLSAGGAALALVAYVGAPRFMSPAARARVAELSMRCGAVGAATVVSLVLAEVVLRLAGVDFERQAVPLAKYRVSTDPRLVYELEPDAALERGGISYRTNAAGFRGPAWPTDGCRALVVGDSLVYGDDVREEDLVSSQLAARLGGPVVAAGVGGYGTYQERRLIELCAPRVRPRAVVLMFSYNDVDDPARHLKVSRPLPFPAEALPVPPAQPAGSARHTEPVPAPDAPYGARDLVDQVARRVSRLYVAVQHARTRLAAPPPAAEESVAGREWEHCLVALSEPRSTRSRWLARELAELGSLARRLSCRLVVALAPLRYQLPPASLHADAPRRTVAALCAAAGLECVDLFPEFVNHRAEGLFVDTGHFSAAGHRVAAEVLAQALGPPGRGPGN